MGGTGKYSPIRLRTGEPCNLNDPDYGDTESANNLMSDTLCVVGVRSWTIP
jgi:hypothetical protein